MDVGHQLSDLSVGKLLKGLGFGCKIRRPGKARIIPIATRSSLHQRDHPGGASAGELVISVDAKKRQLVGDFEAVDHEYEPIGQPVEVRCHDFSDKDLGDAIPYGVYDMKANEVMISAGITNPTPAQANGTKSSTDVLLRQPELARQAA